MKRTLWDIIRGFVFRVFFGHHYDYQAVLEKYGFALTRPMSDLHRLSLMLPYLLNKAMHLNVASVMVLDPKTRQYNIHAEDGDICQLEDQALDENEALVQELLSSKKELFLSEAEKLALASVSEAGQEKYRAITSIMKKLGAQLSIPAISKSQKFPKPTLLFSVNLGKMLSGDNFTHEDIKFLTGFINQIAANMEQAFV